MYQPEEVDVVLKFNADANGDFVETDGSVKSRIRYLFGFSGPRIQLDEVDTEGFEAMGRRFRVAAIAKFTVAGIAYTTDFNDVWRRKQ